MKSLTHLTIEILRESAVLLRTSTTRDINTVTSRVNTEGESFLTITLPAYCKVFEQDLAAGYTHPSHFLGFKRASKHACLPAFMQGFMELVFSRENGRLLDEPSIEAIRCIRQVCLLHSKLFEQADPERTRHALSGYVQCEKHVKASRFIWTASQKGAYVRVARLLFGNLFSGLDDVVYHLDSELVPKFGPGATAERLSSNGRWRDSSWTTRLEDVFPSWFFRIPSERHASYLDQIDVLEPGAEPPVRVITVPKTKKTPRIIAVEPAHMMYVQQALMRLFVRRIESDNTLGKLLGFTNQSPNQELARLGSIDSSLATLDMSEASDRVSLQHVKYLLTDHRPLREAVLACRSTHADVPGYGVMPLSKFASMGSALTFPLEEMVFLTVVFLGIESGLKRLLTAKDVKSLRRTVRIYGDDIIVPADYVQDVIEYLGLYGFKVNSHKSFWTGRFRESCGKEYYGGHDVTVVKLRRRIPSSRQDAQGVQALVAFRNQLYWHGWWQTCRGLDKVVAQLLDGHFPILYPTSPCLGRESVLPPEGDRVDRNLHDDRVKAWRPRTFQPSDSLDGVPALMKCLTSMELRDSDPSSLFPSSVSDHLQHAGRPEKTILNLRWSGLF